ncbi:MAG: hypothetical protein MAG715_00602 [Methanonatronarchaeales archaeon]|nr:hypothetical protein [Methanonatronarchaeales archaeon]
MDFYASEELKHDREKGEEVYARFREELEAEHLGEVVAIDLEAEDVICVGEHREVVKETASTRPETNVYLRKVGSSPEVVRIR